MDKTQIKKVVDASFDAALAKISPAMDRELYPAAFANEYSWLRVKAALDLNNAAIRAAVKDSLAEILAAE